MLTRNVVLSVCLSVCVVGAGGGLRGSVSVESCLFVYLKGSWPRYRHHRPPVWSNIPHSSNNRMTFSHWRGLILSKIIVQNRSQIFILVNAMCRNLPTDLKAQVFPVSETSCPFVSFHTLNCFVVLFNLRRHPPPSESVPILWTIYSYDVFQV